MIQIQRDKVSNEPKGDAMITYEDPPAVANAVEWFNNTYFHGVISSFSLQKAKIKKQQRKCMHGNIGSAT